MLFYALGIALLRSGAAPDDEAGTEAIEAFRTAARLQPDFSQAQAELGKLLLKRSDVPGAIAHLEQALALEPDESAPAYVLAQAYRRTGRTDRAQELLARVSRLNAQERGDDPDTDLRRMMFRIVRDGGGHGGVSRYEHAFDVSSFGGRRRGGGVCCRRAISTAQSSGSRQVVDATSGPSPMPRYQLAVTLWNRYQRATGRRQKSRPGRSRGSALGCRGADSQTCRSCTSCSASCSPNSNSSRAGDRSASSAR